MKNAKFSYFINNQKFDKSFDKIEESFKNDFGTWMISIINSNSNIFGYILLAHHGWTIPEKCMKDVIIKLSFRNSSDRDYFDISATYLPGSNYFIFNTYFDNNFAEWGRKRGYYTFSVDIEFDATSLLLLNEESNILTIVDHVKEMFYSKKLADVTIISTNKEKKIKAHNFILSRSKVFNAMLNKYDTKEAKECVIEITDFDHNVVVEMIRYLYSDEVPKIKQMALDLLFAADKYDISGLADECVGYLEKNVTIANFADVLTAADKLHIQSLKDSVIEFIIYNRKKGIFPSNGWKMLKKNNMALAMEVMENFVLNA